MVPGCTNQIHDVANNGFLHIGLGHRLLHGNQVLRGEHGAQRIQRIAGLPVLDHGQLILGGRIAHGEPDGEAVHLAVGEQLGAGGTGGVLSGQNHKGLGDGMADAVHGDLPLFHGLQQGGLGPGGSPVQLVGQEHIAQHRAGLINHLAGGLLQHGVAGDIGGQHIGGKLDAVTVQTQDFGEGQRHGGLTHAGDILQQDVALGQDGAQHPNQHLVLAHHHPAQLRNNLLSHGGD